MNVIEMRELDAWIAVHVMGLTAWKETPERVSAILNPNEFVLSIPHRIVRARIGNNPTKNFEPTTEPEAGMKVLEKCAEKTVVSMVKTPPSAASLGAWTVAEEKIVECGDTPELAICQFAKKLFTK